MRPPLGSFQKKPPLDEFFTSTGDQPYPVTQKYGEASAYEPQSGGINYGTDVATPYGTPITLPKGNYEVINTYDQADPQGGHENNWDNSGYGNSVLVINKDTGQFARYSHLSDVHVKPGEFTGGTLAKTGASGHITGPHVDIEAYDNEGNQTDPEQTPFTKVFSKHIEKPLGIPEGQDTPQATRPTPIPEVSALNYYAVDTPEEYKPYFDRASKETGVPTHILSSQTKAESNFDPNAQSPFASGVSQFTPDTAKEYGIDPLNPEQAIGAQARYVKKGIDQYGDTDKALASYNAGFGAVDEYGGIPPYPETQGYVKRINEYAQEATASAKPQTQQPPPKKKNFMDYFLSKVIR